MKRVVIYQTTEFIIVSHGNGLAYDMQRTATRESMFLRGDDATCFRAELDDVERRFPDRDTNHNLADLWLQYGNE